MPLCDPYLLLATNAFQHLQHPSMTGVCVWMTYVLLGPFFLACFAAGCLPTLASLPALLSGALPLNCPARAKRFSDC